MFNRLALYFIFSPSRTHLSSFFSPFLPTRALTAWTLFHPFALSLWKRWAQSVVSACLAWRAWHGGARRSDAQEPCCDMTLNVSQSKEWQAFELKHFNDASILSLRRKNLSFNKSCGKSRFDAAGMYRIISDHSSQSRFFIPAVWKWSLGLLFFWALPFPASVPVMMHRW